jgi:hypothetical protein
VTSIQARVGNKDVLLSFQKRSYACFANDDQGHWANSYPMAGAGAPASQSPEQMWQSIVTHWTQAKLQTETLTVRTVKPGVSNKELKDLAIKAWCELFGVSAPSAEEVKKASAAKTAKQKKVTDDWAARLKAGEIEAWNKAVQSGKIKIAKWPGLDLAGAKLAGLHAHRFAAPGANFAGADLSGSQFQQTRLGKSNLSGAKLRDAQWWGVSLDSARLDGADCRNMQLAGSSMCNADCKGADFTSANLNSVDFCGANLTGAILAKAMLIDARYDEHTKFPQGFKPTLEMTWAGTGKSPAQQAMAAKLIAKKPLDLAAFMKRLEAHTDKMKLDKALKMLKADRFKLYAQVAPDHLVGIVKSQSDPDLVYSCKLASDGVYGCCTQNLNICGGLRGSLCKHLLVLIVGLTNGGELDTNAIDSWVIHSKGQKPVLDRDAMSEVFLRYKGAEAGEIDWRPTETIPEDYYAL